MLLQWVKSVSVVLKFGLLLLCVGLFAPSLLLAKDIVVSVSGFGSNRAVAMKDMKRNAVEQAIGVMVKSKTLMQDFEIKKDKILTLSEGFVKDVAQLQSQHSADVGWSVHAMVTVSSDTIIKEIQALKMLQIDAQMPRVAVFADELLNGRNTNLGITESEVIKLLRAKQFNVVDPLQVQRLRSRSVDKALFAGKSDLVQQINARLDADIFVIIKTECTSMPIMAGVSMKTHQVVSSIKVLNAGTGILIVAETSTGRSAHISEQVGCAQAIRTSITDVFNAKLSERMVYALNDVQHNGITIHLFMAAGVTSYQKFKLLRGLLEDVDGMVSVNKRGWNRQSGIADFDVVYRGNSEELADALDAVSLGKSHQHPMLINSVERNRLEIEFREGGD